jgi:serine transporter
MNKYKLDSRDWGYVAINIGMGIGAGIVFLPIQAGLVGLWTFLLTVLIAYPTLYIFQRLFINTLVEAENSDDYPSIIAEYLGKKWGVLLGVVYFIMLIIWVFVYSQTITNDSASFIHTAGITEGLLSDYPLYSLTIITVLVIFAFASRKLLLNISKLLVVFILAVLLLLSFMIIPYWDTDNILKLPSFWIVAKNIIITLPFCMTSILFLQSLSPMVMSTRIRNKRKIHARIKSIKIMNTSFFILAFIVLFFAFSCTMSVSHAESVRAFKENTSFLALMAKVIPGTFIPALGIALSLCAIVTSFFGVMMGFHEACVGLVINTFFANIPRRLVNMTKLSFFITIFIILVAWLATIINFPILYFTSICSPIFAIIGCFIPVLLVYRSDRLKKYRGIVTYIVILTGILLFLSPFLAFL